MTDLRFKFQVFLSLEQVRVVSLHLEDIQIYLVVNLVLSVMFVSQELELYYVKEVIQQLIIMNVLAVVICSFHTLIIPHRPCTLLKEIKKS